MRKKLRSIVSVSYITIIFLLVTILLSNIPIYNTVLAQGTKLIISPQAPIIQADKGFWVKITDENGDPVSDVKVYIQSDPNNQQDSTDEYGIAELHSPTNRDSITIFAEKDSYETSSRTITIEAQPGFLETLINNPYFPIVIATIVLVSAIMYVSLRQRKSIYNRAKEISDDKVLEKYDANVKIVSPKTGNEIQKPEYYSREIVRAKTEQDSKVEEIRISRPYKEKEIVPVKTEEDKTEKIINRKISQKNDYDWFEGTDEIRYEVEKLTGEIDENGIDKWFEGVDELKEKINKKMKKKTKNTE